MIKDDQGNYINPEAWPQVLSYSGGVLQTISFTDGSYTWTQAYTYTGSDLTGISLWVRS